MTTPRIEEMVTRQIAITDYLRGTYGLTDDDTLNASEVAELCEMIVEHFARKARQAGRDEAVEKRPDEPTRWVSEPMTQKEAEIYVQGMYDLMMMVGCDGHCKHYDPLFFEGNTAHSYVLELDDGGRHHSYVTPQWVALKALLEFAQTLKDEWDISGWNEYFANNIKKAINEIEALQDNK